MGRLNISQALQNLEENLSKINSINEWAFFMKWGSSRTFVSAFKKQYKGSPSKMMIEVKVSRAIELLQENPEMPCIEVACAIGKSSEKDLNKFLKHHTGKSPSEYRN